MENREGSQVNHDAGAERLSRCSRSTKKQGTHNTPYVSIAEALASAADDLAEHPDGFQGEDVGHHEHEPEDQGDAEDAIGGLVLEVAVCQCHVPLERRLRPSPRDTDRTMVVALKVKPVARPARPREGGTACAVAEEVVWPRRRR